jgi:hypothetical protein
VEGDITTNELRAQSFLGTIGSRSVANFGTSSIWGALSELHQGLEHSSQSSSSETSELHKKLAAANLKLDSLFSDPNFIRNLQKLTGADISTTIAPFQVVLKDFLSPFFWKYTSHQAAVDYRDKLEARLAALEFGMASKFAPAMPQSSGFFPFAPPAPNPPSGWQQAQGFAQNASSQGPHFGPSTGAFPASGAPPSPPSVHWGAPWPMPTSVAFFNEY